MGETEGLGSMPMWGKHKETGVWLTRPHVTGRKYKTKLLWRGHDSLFVAWRRLRIRIMKPGVKQP